MKTLFLIPLILILSGLIMTNPTQAAGCDHTIPFTTYKVDGVTDNIQPGDVICLQSGNRGLLWFEDLSGTPANPITIQNSGGQLFVEGNSSIVIANSHYVHLTGTGSPDHFYGIKASGTVKVGNLSSNVEVDHLEIYSPSSFAGMMVKTDPSCDPATWRENFTMYDVSLHDNYIHDITIGEGFYIGFTFYDGYQLTCNGQSTTVYGHVIEGLQVYNNILEDIGSEGIQVSSIPNGAQIHHNVVRRYGQNPFDLYQDNGIQISQGNAEVYNNLIDTGVGNGFIIFGTGHKFYNNIILNTGGDAAFFDDRRVGEGITFVNNTIVNPGANAISVYNDEANSDNIIKNNLIIKADNTYQFFRILNDNVPLDMSHNLTSFEINSAAFVDSSQKDYRLRISSTALNAGTDVSALGINDDYAGTSRPQDTLYDQGAYEYKPWLTLTAQALNETIKLTWQADPLPVGATWQITFDGPSTNHTSPISSLVAETRAYTLTGLTNYTPYSITLQAISGSPILTKSATALPTDRFVYLPLIRKP